MDVLSLLNRLAVASLSADPETSLFSLLFIHRCVYFNLVDGIQMSESPQVPQPCAGPALALQSHYLCQIHRPHRTRFETSQTSQTSHRVSLWLNAHLSLAATLSIRPPAGAIGADKTANCQSVSPQSMARPPVKRSVAVKIRKHRPDKVMVRQGLATRLPPPTFFE